MRLTTLLLFLTACLPDETGIDRTILTGTISIPPASISEARGNDSLGAAQPIGPDDSLTLTYRSVVLSGSVLKWTPASRTDLYGDPDYYTFSPVATGPFSFSLSFSTGTAGPHAPPPSDTGDTGDTGDSGDSGDTGDSGVDSGDSGDTGTVTYTDPKVLHVELIDVSTYDAETGAGVVFSENTDGTGGSWSTEVELAQGGEYVLLVAGLVSDEDAALDYTLVLGGSTPDDTTVLVGAYLGEDPLVAENPLGGTNAVDWTYDPATFTWNGTWRMMWLREVIPAEPDTDTGDQFVPAPTVVEGADQANVRAAMLTTLSASPAAGALYTTENVVVVPSGAEQEVAEPLVLDGVRPKVIGVQVAEETPDVTLAEINAADSTLILDTLVAQDLGMLSALGYVDIVTGSSLMDPTYEGWNATNDSDAYGFTVPEEMNVTMTASWDDTAADIDFGIWYEDPDYGWIDLFSSWSDSYCLTGSDPEVCTSAITLLPDTPYYIVALGYLGTGDEPYTIELEWQSP